jgi:hypothetical protein
MGLSFLPSRLKRNAELRNALATEAKWHNAISRLLERDRIPFCRNPWKSAFTEPQSSLHF